ncbi:flagellin [Nitrosococcus halophilus]
MNTNIMSLNAQRNLDRSQSTLQTSLQRLSSGLRINSAKDDAAGLAITDRMTAQIRGLNQAARNANDGISLAQTAEGALHESTSLLQRVRELAVQSANDTNTDADRTSLQNEVTQLIAEMNRIASSTQFNGKSLLDGSLSNAIFHVGANADQTISVGIDDARTSRLGANATLTSTGTAVSDGQSAALTSPSGVLEINGTAITVTSDGLSTRDAAASANAVAAGINALSATTGVSATANATTANLGTITAAATGFAAGDFAINGINITAGAIASGDSDSALRDAINAVQNQTGVTAALNSSNELVLTAADGRNIQLETDGTQADGVSVFGAATFDTNGGSAVDIVTVGTVTLDSDEAFVVDTGITQATHGMAITAGTYNVDTSNAMENVDISTQSGANSALANVDRALSQIDSMRGDLGALQNRFQSTISNLENVSENLSAARSRIRDADFAAETAELTRNQILQQAGTAMLAQANSLPQNVLSLLQ